MNLSLAELPSRSFTASQDCSGPSICTRFFTAPGASRTSITRTIGAQQFGVLSIVSSPECCLEGLVLRSIDFWHRQQAPHHTKPQTNVVADPELLVHPAGARNLGFGLAVVTGHEPKRPAEIHLARLCDGAGKAFV